jgi:hypothetical protein
VGDMSSFLLLDDVYLPRKRHVSAFLQDEVIISHGNLPQSHTVSVLGHLFEGKRNKWVSECVGNIQGSI